MKNTVTTIISNELAAFEIARINGAPANQQVIPYWVVDAEELRAIVKALDANPNLREDGRNVKCAVLQFRISVNHPGQINCTNLSDYSAPVL